MTLEIHQRRLIAQDIFDKIINLLSLRDKVISKLLYFGAPISQNDVLSLRIDQVEFGSNKINYESGPVIYPSHIFSELDLIIGKRIEGYVFTGRNYKKIDPTVPYRAIKRAAAKVPNIDPNFSLKHLSNRL
jgi:hypothetical protein